MSTAVGASVRVDLSPEQQAYLEALGPITVCPDPDWMPFEFVDEEGNFTGIAADLLDLVALRLGIEFTYIFPRDWDEALELSQAGKVMILPFLNQTPAREEWLIFTEPLLVDPNVFVTRAEHPYISNAAELEGRTIVFPSGTSMEERVRRDFPNLRVIHVEREEEVFQAVSDRRADMTLRSLAIAGYTIRKEGLFNLKIAGQAPEAYINRLRMGVLKGEPMLRDILNLGIATITSGEREEILNRHVNITVVRPVDYWLIARITGGVLLLIFLTLFWNWRLRISRRALADSERSKSVFLSHLPGMAYRCRNDEEWTIEFVSDGCIALTGYAPNELMGKDGITFNQMILPDHREHLKRVWQRAIMTRESVREEYRIRTADGQIKWVYELGVALFDKEDRLECLEGLIIDVTDRVEMEECVEAHRRRLAAIVEAADIGTWEWNVETGEVAYNERWAGMAGYSLSDLEPLSFDTFLDLIHPDDAQRSQILMQKHLDGELGHYEVGIRMRHRDGRWIWVLTRGKVVERTPDGKPLLVIGTHRDIDARKQLEEQAGGGGGSNATGNAEGS